MLGTYVYRFRFCVLYGFQPWAAPRRPSDLVGRAEGCRLEFRFVLWWLNLGMSSLLHERPRPRVSLSVTFRFFSTDPLSTSLFFTLTVSWRARLWPKSARCWFCCVRQPTACQSPIGPTLDLTR